MEEVMVAAEEAAAQGAEEARTVGASWRRCHDWQAFEYMVRELGVTSFTRAAQSSRRTRARLSQHLDKRTRAIARLGPVV